VIRRRRGWRTVEFQLYSFQNVRATAWITIGLGDSLKGTVGLEEGGGAGYRIFDGDDQVESYRTKEEATLYLAAVPAD